MLFRSAAGTPQQPGQTQPATPAPAGATGTAPAGQQSMGEDYDDDDMAQVRKIRAKLLRIPGFKRNVSDEQAQLAMAERMYELLKRDMSFDQALVMAQRGNLEEEYMGFEKVKKAAAAGGAKNPAAVAAAIGRKKYGKEKFQKAAAAGKKLGEGDLPPQDGIMGAGLGAGRSQSTMESNKMAEGKKAKPDFLDLDKDGNRKETMKKAAADKKKSVEGSKLTESAYNSAKAGLQRTVDFAKKRGYVIRKSPTSKAVIFFNKDIGHKLAAIVDNDGSSINVNFKDYSSGMSGNDDASYFDKTFKEAYKNALEEHKYQQYVQKHFGDDDMMENITESISLKESPSALEHIVNKFKHEVKNFIAGEELDSDLYDALFDYYAGHGEMPYGIAKARTGDPFEWVTNRFEQDVQDVVDECQMPIRGLVGEEMPAATVPGMADDAMDEGNAFTRGLAKARKGDKFTVAGTTFTDTSNYDDPSVRENSMFESWDNQLSSLLEEYQEIQEGLSISVSKGNEGAPDSVTVSAQDDEADKLLGFIKSAGLGLFGDEQPEAGGDALVTVGGDEPAAAKNIEVVGDHDGMMDLIKKSTGGAVKAGDADYADEKGSEEHGDHDGGLDMLKKLTSAIAGGRGGEDTCGECGMASEACHCGDEEAVDETEIGRAHV